MAFGLSPTAWAVTRFFGWSFLPPRVVSNSIAIYHRILRPASPPPRPGSPEYHAQYKIAYVLFAGAYLIFNLLAAGFALSSNYYSILGVHRTADEQGLKLAFRAFARRNHPDRPGVGRDGEQRFREVRDAFDMLKNPVKRFAYERFGPDVAAWKELSTPKEYIKRGMSSGIAFYIGWIVLLLSMSVLGRPTSSTFWRYVLLAAAFFTEAYLILSPSPLLLGSGIPSPAASSSSLPIFSSFLPNYLPYQNVLFLHDIFVSLSVCISQVGPVLFPPLPTDQEVIQAMSDTIHKLSLVGVEFEREVSHMLQLELQAVRGAPSQSTDSSQDDQVMESLTREMENLFIERRLRAHPVLGSIWERVVNVARSSGLVGLALPQSPALERSSSTLRADETPSSTENLIASKIPLLPSLIIPSSQEASPTRLRATSPYETDNGALSDTGTVASTHSTLLERLSSSPPPPKIGKRPSTPSPSHSPPRSPRPSPPAPRSPLPFQNVLPPSNGSGVSIVNGSPRGARFFPSAFAAAAGEIDG